MSPGPLLRPVGPLPAGVYWRRRAAVVVLVVALVALLVVVLRGLGSADRLDPPVPGAPSEPPPQPTGTSSPTSTPTRTRSPDAVPRDPAPSGPSASGSAAAVAARDCAAGDLRVEVTPVPAEVSVGEAVSFAVRLAATGPACRVDVGPVARSARVLAAGQPVWSTEDCEAGDASEVVLLVPGQARTLSVRWEGARSAPGCPDGLAEPTAGDHAVVVQVGPAVSDEVGFRLVRRQT